MRHVTLLLVGPDGAPLGRLPPFDVDVPWWPEAWPVVDAARERHGLDITILRLVESPAAPHGGAVTYAAEVHGPIPDGPPLRPPAATDAVLLADDPLRQTWARPGGPAAHVQWAVRALAATGRTPSAAPRQIRTWNLSTLWQLPTDRGDAWLKVVPPFFAHEGSVIDALGTAAPTPRLLAHDGARMLVDHIAGEDLYDASLAARRAIVEALVDLQAATVDRLDELASIGVPDLRREPLSAAIADVVGRVGPDLADAEGGLLAEFVARLPERWRVVDAAGLPDVLVHGDAHPGNVRGTATSRTILDWGDSHLGHPLLDQPAMAATTASSDWPDLRAAWHAAWRRHRPDSDPDGAARAIAPIGAALLAVIYQRFLDHVEPSERPYHAADPAAALRRTAAILRAEAQGEAEAR